ncbi:hypothetical protein [Oceanisphaera sp. IT1-181]|uniref:hypothetical protein n=1 Tax=Oceanisphaera sp. IT1-181 TaxID=3081199 RepID=UPI0029CA9325|nr:hypothetical protein [Oceanisphaera sp. IT1-181]
MTVKQRQVFYIHGFDPRGARHYHQLYSSQSAQQASVNGLHIDVSARQRNSSHHHQWQLNTEHTHTQYNYLGWDDIVRQHWGKGWRQILNDLYYVSLVYLLSGNVFTFAKASVKQMMAGLYPIIYILLGTGISLFAAFSGADLIKAAMLHGPEQSNMFSGISLMLTQQALPWLLGMIIFVLLMQGVKKLGDKLAAFWLLRIYAFTAKWAGGKVPALNQRSTAFAEQITKAIQDPNNDEVVIIGHSVGTILAMPTMAAVLAALPHNVANRHYFANHRVVLITLGQCIPLMSFQPSAKDFREHLQQLGQTPHLTWLDYTAPTDGACFPLLDPITSCGLTRSPNAGPQLLSPRFFTLYNAARYKKLRRAWYTMHFLYLMATDKTGPYDFFAFTAGPKRVVRHINTPSGSRTL